MTCKPALSQAPQEVLFVLERCVPQAERDVPFGRDVAFGSDVRFAREDAKP